MKKSFITSRPGIACRMDSTLLVDALLCVTLLQKRSNKFFFVKSLHKKLGYENMSPKSCER